VALDASGFEDALAIAVRKQLEDLAILGGALRVFILRKGRRRKNQEKRQNEAKDKIHADYS
jgi:hypothetical protein